MQMISLNTVKIKVISKEFLCFQFQKSDFKNSIKKFSELTVSKVYYPMRTVQCALNSTLFPNWKYFLWKALKINWFDAMITNTNDCQTLETIYLCVNLGWLTLQIVDLNCKNNWKVEQTTSLL